MNTQIVTTIDEIINKRKNSNDKPRNVFDSLVLLHSAIKKLQEFQAKINSDPNLLTSFQSIRDVNLNTIAERVEQEIRTWAAICHRLNRDTINIGVIGLARQGKSTFLQKVSGLTDDEIPSNDRMPCTSVQSNIYHTDEAAHAKVYFHSEASFLKTIITPYYEELGLSNIPSSIDEFRDQPFPNKLTNPRHPAKAEAVYKHLRDDYYTCINQYRSLLQSQKRCIIIPKNDIGKYVSQDYDLNGQPKFYNHLAVEKVDIFSPFPEMKVKKIGLVDMPGLGDTRLGDAQRMVVALSKDVDFILFVRRPDRNGDLWGNRDVELYDEAAQALKDKLPLEKWSFMLINYDGENSQQCQDLQNTINNKGIHIKACIQGNCKDANEANKILSEVLKDLVTNMESLDNQYMSAAFSGLAELKNLLIQYLQQGKQKVQGLGDIDTQSIKLTRYFIENLYNQVERFRSRMRQELTQPNTDFKKEIELVIQRCSQEVKVVDDTTFAIQVNEYGIYGAYFNNIHEIRSDLMKQLHSLENSLGKSLNQVKSESVEVFIQLGFDKITKNKGLAFIDSMSDLFSESKEFESLSMAFEFIKSFEITYKGFMQSRVWQEVSQVLSPALREEIKYTLALDAIKSLEQSHKSAIQRSQLALNELGDFISNVHLSMVEEFADHLTRQKGVKQEWRVFLNKHRSTIWPQLQKLEQEKQTQQIWIALVDEAITICDNIQA